MHRATILATILLGVLVAAPTSYAQTITFDNGCASDSAWDCADNWDLDRVPQAGDDVVIGSFNVTGSFTSASVNSLALSSTTLNTDGTMSVGQLDWTSGSINDSAFLTITGTGSEWSSNGTKVFNATTLEIEPGAEVVWSGGTVQMNNGALVENAGLFDMQSDNTLDYAVGAADPEFVNEATGTLRKSAGTGTSVIDVFTTNDGGDIEAQTGTIRFDRSADLDDGTYDAVAGTAILFNAGTFTASGTLSGMPAGLIGHDTGAELTTTAGATLDFSGEGYQWQSGTLSAPGAAAVTNAALLVATTNATKVINGDGNAGDRVLRNEGTVRWDGGTVQMNNGALVENAGLFDMQSDNTLDYAVGAAAPEFVNEAIGTLLKSAGSVISVVDVFTTNDGGDIEAQTGTIRFDRSADLNDGTYDAVAGAAILFNAGTFTASGTLSGMPAGFIGHDTGAELTTTAGATLDFSGEGYQWQSGTLSAPGAAVLTNAALLVATTNATKVINGDGNAGDRVLRNEGTVRWDGGTVQMNNGALVENAGLFDMQNNFPLDYAVGAADPEFVNEATGTLRKSTGTVAPGTSVFDVFTTNEGGLVDVEAGTVRFTRSAALNGGTYDAAIATAVLLFDVGTFTASGTLSGSPAGFIGHDISATLTTTAGATLDFSGEGYQWQSGTLSAPGAGLLTNASRFRMVTNSTKVIDGDGGVGDEVLRNEGTVEWNGGTVQMNNGALVENAGLFDLQSDNTLDYATGSADPEFVNEDGGTLRKSAGAGTSTVDVQTTNEAGGVILANSGLLNFTRTVLDNQSGATLGGTASLSPIPTNPYTNDGIIAPGASPGVLDFQAGLTQSSSAGLAIEIAGNGGAAASDGHDQLQVSGDAALDGDIDVTLLGGFTPNEGDTYVVLTANSVSGEFSNTTPNDRIYVGDGVAFTVIYNADNVTLVADILEADYAVTKTVDESAVDVGTDVTFTVTITNDGPDDGSEFGLDAEIEVTDQLPDGLDLVSSSATAGSYDESTGVWSLDMLADGDSETLTIVATVSEAGTFTNTAALTNSGLEDPDGSNDSDSAVVEGQAADLMVEKEASSSSVLVGDAFTFTVTLTNEGPNDATDIVVADEIPSGLTCSATEGTGTYAEADGEWSVPSLAAEASTTLTFDCTAGAAGSYTNTATRQQSSPIDLESGNDEGSATVTVTSPAAEIDLELVKEVDPASATVGDNVTFTLTLTNDGNSEATGVVVTDVLPAGMTYVSDSGGGATSESGGTVTWSVASLPGSGESVELEITATVDEAGTLTNTAQVTAADQDDVDSTPDNDDGNQSEDDEAKASVTVTTPASADLSVTKGPDGATATVGDDVTFTITVTNDGPGVATGVEVTDKLPTGLGFVSASGDGSYEGSTGVWTVGTLASGDDAVLQITASADQAGAFENVAEVTASDQNDPDSTPNNGEAGEDDQDSASVTVYQQCTAAAIVGERVEGNEGIATLQTNDGILRVQVYGLDNLTVKDDGVVGAGGETFTEVAPDSFVLDPDTQTPPASVEVTFEQVDANNPNGSYFVNAYSPCPGAPDGVMMAELDPPMTFDVAVPEDFAFDSVYPNPFRSRATVGFALPEAADVRLMVYDVLGRQIVVLVDRSFDVGKQALVWDGRDQNGLTVAAGIYLMRMEARSVTGSQYVKTQRLLHVK